MIFNFITRFFTNFPTYNEKESLPGSQIFFFDFINYLTTFIKVMTNYKLFCIQTFIKCSIFIGKD